MGTPSFALSRPSAPLVRPLTRISLVSSNSSVTPSSALSVSPLSSSGDSMCRVSESVFPVSPLVSKVLASRPDELPSSLPLCSSYPTFVPSNTSSFSDVFSESNSASTSIKSSPEVAIPASQPIQKELYLTVLLVVN
ncbi:hypothetical protein GEMRC1_009184 [Eukaryota sp. GEM-RC1]